MTLDEYSELLRLFDEDPQQVIDRKIEFEFEEIKGRVRLVDGWAAGTAFEVFEFIDGPYAGKTLFCEVDYDDDGHTESWTYEINVCSDGFLFNWDPTVDVSNIGDGEVTGGDYVPELNGTIFTLKGWNG